MKPRIDVVYEGAYTPPDQWKALQVVTKRMALASTLLIPASGPGQAVGRWGGVQFAKAVQRIVMDPVGTTKRVSGALSTYKRLAGAAAAYNYFNKPKNYKSSGRSSRAYQQNGSPGGTSPSKKKRSRSASPSKSKAIEPDYFVDIRGERRASCPRGYELKRVKGRLMCVRR